MEGGRGMEGATCLWMHLPSFIRTQFFYRNFSRCRNLVHAYAYMHICIYGYISRAGQNNWGPQSALPHNLKVSLHQSWCHYNGPCIASWIACCFFSAPKNIATPSHCLVCLYSQTSPSRHRAINLDYLFKMLNVACTCVLMEFWDSIHCAVMF